MRFFKYSQLNSGSSFPPSEKIAGGFQQTDKKEGGLGEGIFARLLSAEGGMGWEAARPCVSKEAKAAKIDSLIEKIFCARPLKEKEIFADFACSASGGASRWAGFPLFREKILAQKRFALRSVIATNLNIADFAGSLFARSPRLRRGFARIFPCISAQIQRAFENQKSVFCPAGGGSALRNNAQNENFVSSFFLSAFGGIRSQFLFPALYGQRRLIKN